MSDPRGPSRTIVATENDPSSWYLTLDCGHVRQGTRHFWFEVGGKFHCMECKS